MTAFVFRTTPIDKIGRTKRLAGSWGSLVDRVRELAQKGQALTFDCSSEDARLARSNLYSAAHRRDGEKMHTKYAEGAIHVWITFSPTKDD